MKEFFHSKIIHTKIKELTMKKNLFVSFLLITVFVLGACAPKTPTADPATNATSAPEQTASTNYAGKKILWIDSYHQGYAWTDDMENGMHEVLDGTGVELKIVHMDTKRNADDAFIKTAALQAKTEIETFQPDVVIASEDNVQKALIVPNYRGTDLPIVFNGINWTADSFGYPASNITGMLEVELQDQLTEMLKQYAKGRRVGYVTIDTETERKSVDIINKRFFNNEMLIYWATTQDEFKTAFLTAQQEVDIVFLGNNGGTDTWDEAEMKQFFLDNTTIPTGSVRDWMAPYVLVTLAKSGKEQGEWAAQTALDILDGTPVSEIPVVENKKGDLILNLSLADKLGVIFTPSLLKNAKILDD
jgi:ABC-type uncharacterized transport system substrate-binding protein